MPLRPDVTLQPHQERVVERVSGDDPRLLLYHGLGTGKSLASIAGAEASGGSYGVIAPASLRDNYRKELAKFTQGSDPEILSYSGMALGKQFKEQPDTLVVDEAQRIRNSGTASAQAVSRAAENAKRLLLLSGTPIVNSPGDLAGPLSMLTGNKISPEDFEKRFVGHKKINPGFINSLWGVRSGEEPHLQDVEGLKNLLKGHVDYQPGKTPEGVNVNEQVIEAPLTPEQERVQEAVRSKIPPGFLWKLDSEFPLSRDELTRLNSFATGLRQSSLSTQTFRADKDPYTAFQQSGKLQAAMTNLQKLLQEDKRKKALIYSNFIDSGLNPYAAGLEHEHIPYAMFHGGISEKARQDALARYNDGQARALLLGPAGAEGISTKGTSMIQLLDPHWNQSRSDQATGRGLRFDSHEGLPDELKNVAIQKYLTTSKEPGWFGKLLGYTRKRTGDEIISNLAAKKEQLNDEFRQVLKDVGSEKQSMALTAAELGDLVGKIAARDEQIKEAKAGWDGKAFSAEFMRILQKHKQEIDDQRGKHRILSDDYGERKLTRNDKNLGKLPDLDNEALVRALVHEGAPEGSLSTTGTRLGSTDLVGDYDKGMASSRLGPIGKTRLWLDDALDAALQRKMKEGKHPLVTAKQLQNHERMQAESFGPHYSPMADTVVQPWRSPAASMHEYGHAIDFNGGPVAKNWLARQAQRWSRDAYMMAPVPGLGLWQEHAAWRKGQKALIDGAVKHNIPGEHIAPILADAAHAKSPALGSYWGAGIGSVAGAAGLGALGAWLGGNRYGAVNALRLGLVGAGLGGAVGGLGGMAVGGMMSEGKAKQQEDWVKNEYPKLLQARHGVPAPEMPEMPKMQEHLVKAALDLGKTFKTLGVLTNRHDPTLTNALGFGALGALGGGVLGAAHGEQAVDEQGRARPRMVGGALGGALIGGGLGALGGAGISEMARMAPKWDHDAKPPARQVESDPWGMFKSWDKLPRNMQFAAGMDDARLGAIIDNPVNRMAGHGLDYFQGLMR